MVTGFALRTNMRSNSQRGPPTTATPPTAAAAKTFGPKAAAFGARILGCYPRFSNMDNKLLLIAIAGGGR